MQILDKILLKSSIWQDIFPQIEDVCDIFIEFVGQISSLCDRGYADLLFLKENPLNSERFILDRD